MVIKVMAKRTASAYTDARKRRIANRMEKTGYSGVQIALHWAIAGLIVINYFISARMGHALKIHLDGTGTMGGTATVHVYAGVAMLVLVLVRLGVRMAVGVPASIGHGLLDKLAEWAHKLLYMLMIVVPGLGVAAWYLGVRSAGDLHVLAMNAMMLLVLVHAAAALLHQFVLKDRLLLRMLRRG